MSGSSSCFTSLSTLFHFGHSGGCVMVSHCGFAFPWWAITTLFSMHTVTFLGLLHNFLEKSPHYRILMLFLLFHNYKQNCGKDLCSYVFFHLCLQGKFLEVALLGQKWWLFVSLWRHTVLQKGWWCLHPHWLNGDNFFLQLCTVWGSAGGCSDPSELWTLFNKC